MAQNKRQFNFPRVAHYSDKPVKVLFIKVSALGDIIFTAHIGKRIKEMFPNFAITWLTSKQFSNISSCMPWFDNVIFRDDKESNLSLIKRLNKEKFDIIFNMQDNDRSALWSLFTSASYKIGYHKNLQFIYDADVYQVLGKLGIPCTMDKTVTKSLERPPGPSPIGEFRQKNQGPCLAFSVGTSKERKCWPKEYWLEMSKKILKERKDVTILLLGSGDVEQSKTDFIEKGCNDKRVLNLCNKLSLTELLQVLSDSSFMVAGDTGPLHMARALGKQAIALFGPTSLSYAYSDGFSRVLYTPCENMGCLDWSCSDPCMERITVDSVYNAVMEVINV